MNKICLEILLKIVRIFYFSSLNKFESYRLINESKLEKIEEKPSNSSMLVDMFSGELGDEILNCLDYNLITESILDLLLFFANKDLKSYEDISISDTAFELLNGILCYAPNSDQLEATLINNKSNEFKNIALFGLLNNNFAIRNLFSSSLVKYARSINDMSSFLTFFPLCLRFLIRKKKIPKNYLMFTAFYFKFTTLTSQNLK